MSASMTSVAPRKIYIHIAWVAACAVRPADRLASMFTRSNWSLFLSAAFIPQVRFWLLIQLLCFAENFCEESTFECHKLASSPSALGIVHDSFLLLALSEVGSH